MNLRRLIAPLMNSCVNVCTGFFLVILLILLDDPGGSSATCDTIGVAPE
jgi:hypothetical protein